MNEELIKLREFAAAFRIWKREMNNHSFRKVLDRLREVDQVAAAPSHESELGHACVSGACE